jgi:hypothetical protein
VDFVLALAQQQEQSKSNSNQKSHQQQRQETQTDKRNEMTKSNEKNFVLKDDNRHIAPTSNELTVK